MIGNQDITPEKSAQHLWHKDLIPSLQWGACICLLLGILIQIIGRAFGVPVSAIGIFSWLFFSFALVFFVLWATFRLMEGARPPKKPAHEDNSLLLWSLGLVLASILVKIGGGLFPSLSYWLDYIFGYLLILSVCLFIYWVVTHFMFSLNNTPAKRLDNMAFFKAFLVLYLLLIPVGLLVKGIHDPSIMPEDSGIKMMSYFIFVWVIHVYQQFHGNESETGRK